MSVELREYQIGTVADCVAKIKQYGVVYLAAEVRTGKSITSLTVMQELNKTNVLFVTSVSALADVKSDYIKCEYDFEIKIINREQVKNLSPMEAQRFDGIIIDEAHRLGAMPKPSAWTISLKEIVGKRDLILMSGTPSPESFSQLFHQFWISENSPWAWYKNFYMWAGSLAKNNYVIVRQKRIANQKLINDYSIPNSAKIAADFDKYVVALSQKEAGFKFSVQEEFLEVPLPENVKAIIRAIKADKIYTFDEKRNILADTAVKMQTKLRQLFSGHCKTEEGEYLIIDDFKAQFIKNHFAGKKIAIYHCFISEGEMLKKVFPKWTDDHNLFNSRNDLTYIKQVVSGREGVSLRTAEMLVFFNTDFSATSYWQARDRQQYLERESPPVIYWVRSGGIAEGKNGIEHFVYEAVSKKMNYTKKFFVRDLKKMF